MLDENQKKLAKKIIPYAVEVLVLAFSIVLDLTMKDYLYKFLNGGTRDYVVIKGFFGLTYTENTGAGFGIFHGNTLPLTIITFVLITLITAYLIYGTAVAFSKKKPKFGIGNISHWARIALVFIVGGGIGNLVDRFMVIDGTAYFKGVRDYFEFLFFDFPIFNVADAFVTIGAIWLVVYLVVMLVKDSVDESKKMKEKLAAVSTAETQANDTDASADANDLESANADANDTEGANSATDSKGEQTSQEVDDGAAEQDEHSASKEDENR